MGDSPNFAFFAEAFPNDRGADLSLPVAAGDAWVNRTTSRESFLMAIAEECRMGPLVANGKTGSGLPYRVEYHVDDRGKPYLQGWCKVRHASGLLAAFGRYEKGGRHGVWYFWGRHGELLDEVVYHDGVREEYVVCRNRQEVTLGGGNR